MIDRHPLLWLWSMGLAIWVGFVVCAFAIDTLFGPVVLMVWIWVCAVTGWGWFYWKHLR